MTRTTGSAAAAAAFGQMTVQLTSDAPPAAGTKARSAARQVVHWATAGSL
jgi:hypothetical protein